MTGTHGGPARPPRVTINVTPDRRLSIIALAGGFDRDALMQALDRAVAEDRLLPGIDRLTVIGPEIDVDSVAVHDLDAIQRRIAALERASRREASLRSIFVADKSQARITLEIYCLLWERDADIKPDFYHVQMLAVAGAILGRPALATELGRLI